MLTLLSISRYRAAGLHLLLSIFIGLLALALMWFVWYPSPLFFGMGGNELALLIVGVDIAIGPLATLIVFNPTKKSRKELLLDLSVIACLQLGALAYGTYAMYQGRPVFTVFTGNAFAVVTTPEIEPTNLAKAPDTFRPLSFTGPVLVAAEPPKDPHESSDIAFAEAFGSGIQHYPKYFVAYSSKHQDVLSASKPLSELALEEKDKAKLAHYLTTSSLPTEQLRCLPVRTKKTLMTAIIDGHNGDLLDILNIQPILRQPADTMQRG
jgi:hypothetical protein